MRLHQSVAAAIATAFSSGARPSVARAVSSTVSSTMSSPLPSAYVADAVAAAVSAPTTQANRDRRRLLGLSVHGWFPIICFMSEPWVSSHQQNGLRRSGSSI